MVGNTAIEAHLLQRYMATIYGAIYGVGIYGVGIYGVGIYGVRLHISSHDGVNGDYSALRGEHPDLLHNQVLELSAISPDSLRAIRHLQ
jgi:hypothetical protein